MCRRYHQLKAPIRKGHTSIWISKQKMVKSEQFASVKIATRYFRNLTIVQ